MFCVQAVTSTRALSAAAAAAAAASAATLSSNRATPDCSCTLPPVVAVLQQLRTDREALERMSMSRSGFPKPRKKNTGPRSLDC